MTYNKKKSQKGFTLVELAIVLVIIGLIVSGVLVGQDLIRAAELRATVRQLQEYQVGVNTFIGRFEAIPGDADSDRFGLCGGDAAAGVVCPVESAENAGTGCDGEANQGDGNGFITDSAGGSSTHNGEVSCFWSHLTTPGRELIKGVYDGHTTLVGATTAALNDVVGQNMPRLKFGARGWGVFTDGAANNFFIAGVIGAQADDAYDTANVFVPIDAFGIDDKIDDGVPTTGDVQSRGGGTDNPDTAASTAGAVDATVCNNTGANPDEYQFTALAAECTLRFRMQTF